MMIKVLPCLIATPKYDHIYQKSVKALPSGMGMVEAEVLEPKTFSICSVIRFLVMTLTLRYFQGVRIACKACLATANTNC
jgi:hypothetical protein